jgi:hypothetical protein
MRRGDVTDAFLCFVLGVRLFDCFNFESAEGAAKTGVESDPKTRNKEETIFVNSSFFIGHPLSGGERFYHQMSLRKISLDLAINQFICPNPS